MVERLSRDPGQATWELAGFAAPRGSARAVGPPAGAGLTGLVQGRRTFRDVRIFCSGAIWPCHLRRTPRDGIPPAQIPGWTILVDAPLPYPISHSPGPTRPGQEAHRHHDAHTETFLSH